MTDGLSFRYLSGCGVHKVNIQGALFMLETLTVQLAETAPADVLAQGHCAAAYAYWQDWCTTDPASRAFIDAEVKLNTHLAFGAAPTASTTLFQASAGTQCLVSHGQALPTRTAVPPALPPCRIQPRSCHARFHTCA